MDRQGFSFYWLGLGMRSALLPDSAVSVELASPGGAPNCGDYGRDVDGRVATAD